MKVTNITKTIRSTKRFTNIVKVLSKFGFREIVVDMGLDSFGGKKNEEFPEDPQYDKESSRPVRMRHVLEELGPTYIKLGQILREHDAS